MFYNDNTKGTITFSKYKISVNKGREKDVIR